MVNVRLFALLLFLSVVASSFADLRLPFHRSRRTASRENDRLLVTDLAEASRMKQEPDSSEATESTAESTTDPTTVTSDNTKEPVSTTESTPTSNSATSSTIEPTTKSTRSKPRSTAFTPPATKSTTPKSDSTTTDASTEFTTLEESTSSDPTTESSTPDSTSTTASPTTKPSTASKPATKSPPSPKSTTPTSSPTTKSSSPAKPTSTTSSPTTRSSSPAKPTFTTSSPSAKSSSPSKPASTTSSPTAKSSSPSKPASTSPNSTTKPNKSSETRTTPKMSTTTEKPDESASPTESPALGSRFGPSDDNPEGSSQKSVPELNVGPDSNLMNVGFPNFPFTPFFMPGPMLPYNPYNSYNSYNPYVDPNVNVIPSQDNYPWTGSNSGAGGAATSFASASASASASGAPYDANYNNPSIAGYQGGFIENEPNVANTANVPDMVNPGLYVGNLGGAPLFDPAFAFPSYNLDNFQKQMEENFKRFQAQFQQQQQAIFDGTNRIGSDGSFPGAHTAISSINLGPEGGFQSGAINPAAPGIESRFGEDVPPPSGGTYGVFSSSSSHTMVGPDGKTVSHKVATTGVNDNGKITFRTVKD